MYSNKGIFSQLIYTENKINTSCKITKNLTNHLLDYSFVAALSSIHLGLHLADCANAPADSYLPASIISLHSFDCNFKSKLYSCKMYYLRAF